MTVGYDGKLYILAFDHRGSFQKNLFGVEGDPTAEKTERIADAKPRRVDNLTSAMLNLAPQVGQSGPISVVSFVGWVQSEGGV